MTEASKNLSEKDSVVILQGGVNVTPTPFMKLDISTTRWIFFCQGEVIFTHIQQTDNSMTNCFVLKNGATFGKNTISLGLFSS